MWDSFAITTGFAKFSAYWNRYVKRHNKANTRQKDLSFSHNQTVTRKLLTCISFKLVQKSYTIPIRFNSSFPD
jgi:hypothetical protein